MSHGGEQSTRLEPGGSPYTTPEIDAKEKFGRTLVEVDKGALYRIDVAVTAPLFDKKIRVDDTDGFTSESQGPLVRIILKLFESRRRVPEQNWFHLIGTVGRSESHHFAIGTGADSIEAPATGELFCFLNDHPRYYGNNRGKFRLRITRL